MPIDISSLVEPVSAIEPGGADVRYDAVTATIKEARRKDDSLAQGVWTHEVKTADYPLVIRLSQEVLRKRSKDLQIAAWLTEALAWREGFSGLRQGLELIDRLLRESWDTVYPLPDEDGDLEMRATPLRWVATQLDEAVRSVPLTRAGHNWYQYRESRSLPTEDEASADMDKASVRNDAIADGRLLPEEFERGFEATPPEFLSSLNAELTGLIEFIDALASFCDGKFGEASPDFGPLKKSLEDVRQIAHVLVRRKGVNPVAAAEPETEEQPQYEPLEPQPEVAPQSSWQPPRTEPALRSGAPSGLEDAAARLQAVARYLRLEFPSNPAGYSITRGLRWGELRAAGSDPDPALLVAPPTDLRIELKRLASEADWERVLEVAETAAGQPCGRAWLDVQRYAATACRIQGNDTGAATILAGLKALLAEYPQLPEWSLIDDTPAANPETLQWLRAQDLLPISESAAQLDSWANREHEHQQAATPEAEPVDLGYYGSNGDGEFADPLPAESETEPEATAAADISGQPAEPAAYDLARAAAEAGDLPGALAIMSREIASQQSGRERFFARARQAQLCLATGNTGIALPILQDLAAEIERRGLEEWETGGRVSAPLAMLHRCLSTEGAAPDEIRSLYARICRLAPARALELARR